MSGFDSEAFIAQVRLQGLSFTLSRMSLLRLDSAIASASEHTYQDRHSYPSAVLDVFNQAFPLPKNYEWFFVELRTWAAPNLSAHYTDFWATTTCNDRDVDVSGFNIKVSFKDISIDPPFHVFSVATVRFYGFQLT